MHADGYSSLLDRHWRENHKVDTPEISLQLLQNITFIRPLYRTIISDDYYYRKSAEKREIINRKGRPQNNRMPCFLFDSISTAILFLCTTRLVSITGGKSLGLPFRWK